MNRILCSFRYLKPALLALAAAGALAAQTFVVTPAMVSLSAQAGSSAPVTQVLTVGSSGDASGMHLPFVAFTSNVPWLTITSSPTGTTPTTLTIAANPTGLSTGVYNGQLTIVANNGSMTTAIVPVTFTIGELGATPTSLSFIYQTGGVVPLPQSVQVIGPSTPVTFTASTSVTSGSNWLAVSPASGTTPESLSVSLVSTVLATLAAGTYNGQVVLVPSGGAALNIPVTLTVTALPQLSATPASLAFNYQTGGTNNITQQMVSLSSPEGAVNFGAAATVSGGVQWLAVSPTSGATPATLTVTISPSSLSPGTYSGSITVVAPGTAGVTISVSLFVSSSPLISISPTSLAFTYQAGTPSPASQSVTTASTGAAISYTVGTTTMSGGNWLSATGGGTTPNPITVSVNPAGLSAGTYNGTVTVTAAGAGNSPQQIPVALTVTNNALIEAAPNALLFTYQLTKALPANQTIAVTSTGGTLNYTAKAATTSGGNWLWVAPNMGTTVSGSTPGSITVMVLTTNAQPGTYHGTITITATNGSSTPVSDSPLIIPVTYYVSDNALLEVDHASLSFSASTGAVANAQTVNLNSTSDTLDYSISVSPSGSWLTVSPLSGMTPGSFFAVASASGLASGTYTGSIVITATNSSGPSVADSPLTIPVTFQVLASALTVTPASLSFTQVLGSAAPPPQNLTVSNSGSGAGAVSFTVAATTTSGGNWLIVPTSGNTLAPLTVSVNDAALGIGTYTGTITITPLGATGSQPVTVPVTLAVQAVTIAAAPSTLTFNYTTGAAAPSNQTVMVTASSGTLTFTAAAATSGNSGNWLSVLPTSGSTPGTLNVAVNPTGLAVGTYSGTITITAAAGNSPQKVNVTLNVSAPVIPIPVISSITNAGSFALGPVAPGELVSIFGTNLGPSKGAYGSFTNSTLSTNVANIQVMFDSNPAPLLYVSAAQINAVVPFEVFGRTHTELTVVDSGVASAALDLTVGTAAPGIFTVTQNGMGEGAILNQDSSINSATNPAAKGSVIQVYCTGGGQTNPAGVTGHQTPGDGTGLKHPVATVTATVGGLPATVQYAGSAPGFVEGTLQVNLQMASDVPSGPQPVVLNFGGVLSQSTATVAVQ